MGLFKIELALLSTKKRVINRRRMALCNLGGRHPHHNKTYHLQFQQAEHILCQGLLVRLVVCLALGSRQ